MIKNINSSKQKLPIIIATAILLVALILGVVWYISSRSESKNVSYPNSTVPYVDGQSAVDQVGNFYKQYIAAVAKPDTQKILVNGYGSHNLAFYKEYYIHGFDPITCSKQAPTGVSTKLVSEGPTAKVVANLAYPDGSNSAIEVSVVLNDGLQIDSVKCPAPNGDLAPLNSN